MDLATNYGKELYKFFNEKEDIRSLEIFELRLQILFALKDHQRCHNQEDYRTYQGIKLKITNPDKILEIE